MTTPSPAVVLDASAVLAWALNERGAGTVDKVLAVAVLPAPHLTEVLDRARERGHRQTPAELLADLLAKGVRIEAVAPHDAARAAELIIASRSASARQGSSSLSLGDGLCIAVAERLVRMAM